MKLVEDHSGDSGTTYRPVFVFRDSKEREHEIHSSVGSYPPAYKVNDKVSVLYNVEEPENAVIDGFFFIWLMPFVLGIIGAARIDNCIFLLLIMPILWKPK